MESRFLDLANVGARAFGGLGPIDLTVRPGETVFLVGGNGGGKTTLVKLLTGLYPPDTGMIRHGAAQVVDAASLASYRQLFTAVFTDGFLFPNLPGAATPERDARRSCPPCWPASASTAWWASKTARFTTTRLSSGQRKRLALASACLEDRPVLVLDEWASYQIPGSSAFFYREILPALKKPRGTTLVVVSHDEAYFDAADRLVHLTSGAVDNRPDTLAVLSRPLPPSPPRPSRPSHEKAFVRDFSRVGRRRGGRLVLHRTAPASGQFPHGSRQPRRPPRHDQRHRDARTRRSGRRLRQIPGEVLALRPIPTTLRSRCGHGTRVEPGTPLLRLDDKLFVARVNQAKANVTKAEADIEAAKVKVAQTARELDRVQRLAKSRSVSASETDSAIADADAAKAALVVAESALTLAKANQEEADVNFGYTTIKSPVKGVIVDRRVNLGQLVNASAGQLPASF